jgi:hypothetical protein
LAPTAREGSQSKSRVNWEQVEAGEGGDEKGRVGEGNSEGVNMDEGSLGLLRRRED